MLVFRWKTSLPLEGVLGVGGLTPVSLEASWGTHDCYKPRGPALAFRAVSAAYSC